MRAPVPITMTSFQERTCRCNFIVVLFSLTQSQNTLVLNGQGRRRLWIFIFTFPKLSTYWIWSVLNKKKSSFGFAR